jgi:CRP-like cAMP-binding protein
MPYVKKSKDSLGVENLGYKCSGFSLTKKHKCSIKIESAVLQKTDIIKAFRLFQGLCDKDMFEILSKARVIFYNKGKIVFLQGEVVENFYIVLDGSVKIFLESRNGEEFILQIAKSGDGVFFVVDTEKNHYPVNAQSLEDCVLLAIPAQIMRIKLHKNHHIAVNMINNINKNLRYVIDKFEHVYLKPTTYRVIRYLLQLVLDCKPGVNKFLLPYEKSTIASYLGMTPETFSRVIKSLKKIGVIVKNKEVTIADRSLLCKKCMAKNSEKCSLCSDGKCNMTVK